MLVDAGDTEGGQGKMKGELSFVSTGIGRFKLIFLSPFEKAGFR